MIADKIYDDDDDEQHDDNDREAVEMMMPMMMIMTIKMMIMRRVEGSRWAGCILKREPAHRECWEQLI